MEQKLETEVQEVLVEDEMTSNLESEVKKSTKPLSKNAEAKILMKNAEELIVAADNEVNEVHSVVAEHVSLFEKEKSALLTGALAQLSSNLEKVNYTYIKDEVEEPFEVSLGTNKEKLKVKNVGSGRFSALFCSILGTLATAGAWIYFASQKTATALDPTMLNAEVLESIPTNEKFTPMFSWIGGGMTGGAGNALFGIITLIISSLLVGYFIYKMSVAIKESRNFRVANKTFDRTHNYVENQKESKIEMEKVDAHIKELTPLLTNYRMLLEEENAKLQRVLHIEGELEDSYAYHSSSQEVMRDSEKLMRRVEQLISVPITQEGRLNEASTYALLEAKATYEGIIAKIYN